MSIQSDEGSTRRGDTALMRWRAAMDILRELQLQYTLAKKNRDTIRVSDLKAELDSVSLACDLMLAEAVVAQRRAGA